MIAKLLNPILYFITLHLSLLEQVDEVLLYSGVRKGMNDK